MQKRQLKLPRPLALRSRIQNEASYCVESEFASGNAGDREIFDHAATEVDKALPDEQYSQTQENY